MAARAAGAAGYLPKPFTVAAFDDLVDRALTTGPLGHP
jgi:hypothetical protein